MKNLKRVLSLALSGIMLVGMMAVGAGAVNAEDFTDADEITHTEAVSISTALKIIDGKEDGSFDPDGYVTRGQMAKMITRAMFGGEDPVLGLPGTPSFTDIKGRWDEKYIEYCANNSIINGRGDGTFDPEGNVTGTEAAKMLLTALGYKADIYGLVGPDWALTTNSIANQTKVNLYGGLKGLDPNTAFTRDQVAQMVYNTLNANTREMNPTMEITGKGDITYQYTDSGRSLLYDKYGAVRVEGIVTDNEFTDNSDGMKGKTTITITNGDELKEELGLGSGSVNATAKLSVASGKDVFKRAVIVYVKPSNTNKKDLGKGVVISDVIYDVDTNTEFTTTGDTSKGISKWADDKGLKFEDRDTTSSSIGGAEFFTNYAPAVGSATFDNSNTLGEFGDMDSSFVPSYKNVQGIEITVIDNDGDGIVDAVLQNLYLFGKVTKYTEKGDNNVTVKTAGFKAGITGAKKAIASVTPSDIVPANAKMKNVVAYEDIAVDDYVNVTKVHNTYYIEKAETAAGELESFENDPEEKNSNAAKSATVDGTLYKVSKTGTAHADLKSMDEITKRSVLTNEVTLYLDKFGYAVAGETAATSDWLFVANAAVNNAATSLNKGTLTAYVYMQDGTSGSYIVDKYTIAGADPNVKNGTGTASGGTEAAPKGYVDSFGDDSVDNLVGKLFKYSISSNGHLVLEGATKLKTDTSNTATALSGDTKGTQNEVTVADDTKGIVYDRELSKLTIGTPTGTPMSGLTGSADKVKYVTMDTPVFFVTLDGGDIDKVQVFDMKTAPSLIYKAGDGDNALIKSNAFVSGVTYVSSKDSTYDLDAVVFTSTGAVGSDWLFVVEYMRSIDGSRVYRAIVDGEFYGNEDVDGIHTTDVVGSSRKGNTAYSYSMDGDLYALDKEYNAKMVKVGQVTLIDRKSVIVATDVDDDGVEAKITANTATATIDGEDTTMDASVAVGDVVYLIYNESREAEAIFVLADYDNTESNVVYTDSLVTYNDTTKKYEVSKAALDTAVNGTADADDVKALFACSGKAKAYIFAASSVTAGTTKVVDPDTAANGIEGMTESTTLSVANFQLVVVSEDACGTNATTGYTVYTIDVKA